MTTERKNGVLADMSAAVIGDRLYRAIADSELGIMADDGNREKIIVQRHSRIDDVLLDEIKNRVKQNILNNDIDCNYEDDEERLLEIINGSRKFRTLVYPFTYFPYSDEVNGESIYTISELPNDFCEKYYSINNAVRKEKFPFHSRIVAAVNMAEAIAMLRVYFKDYLERLIPEAFYVNVENGDIKVIIDRLMSSDNLGLTEDQEYLRIKRREMYKLETEDLLKFAAYTSFRLICIESPYDGKETLIKYPLLTVRAYAEINSGKYGFIFSKERDALSEYTDKEMQKKWNSVPRKVRETISEILDSGGKCDISIGHWLKNMRTLRDCLVYVNGQFKLCDPDVSNKVSFLSSDEYSIPIWPKKALYWYHVGIDIDKVDNEIVAGISADGYMENLSKITWMVRYDSAKEFIIPGEKIKPVVGMEISINEICFKVVNGEKPVRTGTDLGSPPDYAAFGTHRSVDVVDLNEI